MHLPKKTPNSGLLEINTGGFRKCGSSLKIQGRELSRTSSPGLGALTLGRETKVLEPRDFSLPRRTTNTFKICVPIAPSPPYPPPPPPQKGTIEVWTWSTVGTGGRLATADNDHEVAGIAFGVQGSGPPGPPGVC